MNHLQEAVDVLGVRIGRARTSKDATALGPLIEAQSQHHLKRGSGDREARDERVPALLSIESGASRV